MRDRLTDWISRRIPLSVYRRMIQRDLVCFYYHMVSDEPLPHVRHLYPYKSTAEFEQDLQYIRANLHPVSYEQVLRHTVSGEPLPSRAVLLTFDDGFRECYSAARPLLRKYEIPCVFFIPANVIDNQAMLYRQKVSLCIEALVTSATAERQQKLSALNRTFERNFPNHVEFIHWLKQLTFRQEDQINRACAALGIDIAGFLANHKPYLTAEEICAMASEGLTIGAHTLSHPLLRLCTPEEIEEQIAGSCQALSQLLGVQQVPFSFPFSAVEISRPLLTEIRARSSAVGLMFDSMNLERAEAGLINRIAADQPGESIPVVLHRAYRQIFHFKVNSLGKSV